MDGVEAVRQLAEVIDGHRWGDLPDLLHEDFTCRLVHTGETFDKNGWVRFNAEYPGFQRFLLHDLVGDGDRAAVRAHVTGQGDEGGEQHFEVALFVTVRDGLIAENTEVWTDVEQVAPQGTRPG